MSYILDALKKAEAERRMGTAPETRAAAGAPRYQPGTPSTRPLRLIIVVLLALLAGAGIGFAWQTWHRAPTAAPRAASAPPQATTAPAPAAPPAIAEAPPKAEEAPPVGRAAPSSPAAAEQRPVLRHVRPPAPVRHSASQAATAQRPAAAPAPSAEAAAVVTLQQLPAAIRSRIPPLATSGYLYSGNPADRSVVLNGRLLREGDRVAPQLTLEQLLPDGMVLNYDGHRFRTAY